MMIVPAAPVTRGQQYQKYMRMHLNLLLFAQSRGIPIRFGSAHRDSWVAQVNADPEVQRLINEYFHRKLTRERKVGKANSMHIYSLAHDLWVYTPRAGNPIWIHKDDAKNSPQQLKAKQQLLMMGEYWESMGGYWGGRIKSFYDGYHFDLGHRPLSGKPVKTA